MNWFEEMHLLSLANLLMCLGICWVCVCRLHRMSTKTRGMFVWNYAAMLAGAAAAGLQPVFFQEFAGWGDLIFSTVMLCFLASGRTAWRERAPDYTRKAR
jgi:hypothetical protein